MSDKLKPCPFCGSKSMLILKTYGKLESYMVVCTQCGARTSGMGNQKGAINNWNRRNDK